MSRAPDLGGASLGHFAAASHQTWRSPLQIGLTAAIALAIAAVCSIPSVGAVLGAAAGDVFASVAAFLAVSLAAAFAHRRAGFESPLYQALNRTETLVTVAAALWLVYRSGGAGSPFWVVYFAVVGQAASFGANVRWNTLVFSLAPAALAAAFLASGREGSGVISALVGGVAAAGYRLTLAATRAAALAFDDRRRLAEQEQELSVLRERERIGRDLHDGLGAELTGILYRLQELELEEKTRGELAQRLTDVLDELRSVVWMLRRPQRDLGELAAWLRTRLAELGASGVKVQLEVEGDEALGLPADLALHLVHVALESVRNAVRHSGARLVAVRLSLGADAALEIRDDGRGFSPAQDGGGGLSNLRARAEALGGALTVSSGEGGTQIAFRCPAPTRPVPRQRPSRRPPK